MTRQHPGTRRRRPSVAFPAVLLALAVLLAATAVPNLGRGIRAATGEGAAGTFTAARLDCVQHPGHESCTCYGHYRAQGSDAPRANTHLYGADRQSCRVGESVPALDVGAATRVYAPQGANEWMFTAALLASGLALTAWAVRALVAAVRSRR